MPNNIQYSKSPNETTAFVVQEGGQKNRAVLTAPQDTTTLELPDNPNSTKGFVTIDGKKHKVILTADISGNGGGGGGAVDSVNGKTGVVVLDATDVGAVPQYETMPTADASNVGEIAQYSGATAGSYTNGYFYKCVSDGQEPATYSWTRIDVQPQPVIPDPLPDQTGNNGKFLSTNGTTASWETVGGLPDQTGQSGKFLTTDGTDASWATINALQNTATGTGALTILGTPTSAQNVINIGSSSESQSDGSVCVGYNAGTDTNSIYSICIGDSSYSGGTYNTSIGAHSSCGGWPHNNYATAIGSYAKAVADYAIQLGSSQTNSDANTFKVANSNGNFEMMDANGNLPADRIADTTGLTAGNYLPRLTIDAQGNKTITWVAE